MTDKDIIKALWRLEATKDYLREKYQEDLKNCEFPELKSLVKQTYKDNKKAFDIAIKAIEDYNRQQAELERLEKWVDMTRKTSMQRREENMRKDKLIIKMSAELKTAKNAIEKYKINNIVKEMMGEDK